MTGMRRGEALGLKWPDVDFEGARVSIQRFSRAGRHPSARAPTEDTHGPTRGTLDAVTLAALKAWKARQAAERLAWGPAWSDGGWVFTREDGEPLHPGL